MTGKKIIYNKVVHDILNKLIEFKPSKDTLEEATNNSLRVVFNLKNNEVKKVNQRSKEAPLEEKSQKNIKNEVKDSQDERERDNSAPPPDQQVEKNDQSLKFVLETYINEHADLETRIAYLLRYGSKELLYNIQEKLRQSKHDEYVYMIQAAEEVAIEGHNRDDNDVLYNQKNNVSTNNDEDEFISNDLLNNIFKEFNHAEDDLVNHILRHSEEPQHTMPLLYLVKEFKNVIFVENSGNPQDKFRRIDDKDKTNNRHQNTVVQLLCDKYITSNPIERENLLKVLDNLHLQLETKENKILNKKRITQKKNNISNKIKTQDIRQPNLSR